MSYKCLPLPKPEWPLNLTPADRALHEVYQFYDGLRLELRLALESPYSSDHHLLFLEQAIRQLEEAMPALKERGE